MTLYVLIAFGGIAGAISRFVVSTAVAGRFDSTFPLGTFLINLSGSFILGFFVTVVTDRFDGNANATYFVATGFLGAYTTFSTFMIETIVLVRKSAFRLALLNVGGSAILGVAGAGLGIACARLLGT
jgi:CrcB protein